MRDMATINPNRIYRDLDLNFITHPDDGDVASVVDVNSIRQALKVLVLSQFGERLFQPDVGSPTYGLLFEPADEITTELLKQSIAQVITGSRTLVVQHSIRLLSLHHQTIIRWQYFTLHSPQLVSHSPSRFLSRFNDSDNVYSNASNRT